MSLLSDRYAEDLDRFQADAADKQKAYRKRRKAWAHAVGRPYTRKRVDVRPPPGEVDDDDPEE